MNAFIPQQSEIDIDKDYYNCLLLSLYFYLKHNKYNKTADALFNEGNLPSIFDFPNNNPINEKQINEEKLKKAYINSFYYNSFFQPTDSFDLISSFWTQFWNIFVLKIKGSRPFASPIESYLNKQGKLKLTYNKDMYHN